MDVTLGLGSALGGVVSGIAGGIAAKKQYKYQRKLQQQQNEYNMAMYQQQVADQRENWQMQNAYDSPAAQMQRYRDAGLNANLIYGQMQDSGNIAGASPAYQDADLSTMAKNQAGFGHAFSNVFRDSLDAAIKLQNVRKIGADTEVAQHQTAVLDKKIEEMNANINLARQAFQKEQAGSENWESNAYLHNLALSQGISLQFAETMYKDSLRFVNNQQEKLLKGQIRSIELSNEWQEYKQGIDKIYYPLIQKLGVEKASAEIGAITANMVNLYAQAALTNSVKAQTDYKTFCYKHGFNPEDSSLNGFMARMVSDPNYAKTWNARMNVLPGFVKDHYEMSTTTRNLMEKKESTMSWEIGASYLNALGTFVGAFGGAYLGKSLMTSPRAVVKGFTSY